MAVRFKLNEIVSSVGIMKLCTLYSFFFFFFI
uniref:Uncharacterized protein n=1 Tax=Musa acuminata subsp. malaccensis TaxID=214687 RepID=A0A804IBG3_MUSAM